MSEAIRPPIMLLDVPHAVYHADLFADVPTISRGIAHRLISRSPLHAWAAHPRLGAQQLGDDTKARTNGSLLHALLFQGGQEVAIVEADDWRTAKAREARDAALARDALPVLVKDYDEAQVVAGFFTAHLLDVGVDVSECGKEAVILWQEDGALCRARLDLLNLDAATIYDAKFIRNGNPQAFARTMVYDGYDIQHAAYTRALAAIHPELAGRITMRFLLCETSPPYAVALATPAGSMRDLGEQRWSRAVRTWQRCLESGKWPGYEAAEVEAPAWSLTEEFDSALRTTGTPEWMGGDDE